MWDDLGSLWRRFVSWLELQREKIRWKMAMRKIRRCCICGKCLKHTASVVWGDGGYPAIAWCLDCYHEEENF